ncbi:putative U-box domain-containing protein 50 [Actinidia eriantha]|uniref:putative U-box domain-containing protein 50 n=1 Tax=Actinidia eriantha TaxID=165200 RepID=UPI00258DA981|nr:putative U-box domain-containing protein 50 [Actinidia eriantha]
MDSEAEKVYVAVGNDSQDGFLTLEWALKKWSSQSISIVILHAPSNTSKDYVYTPMGKLPVSYVSDEKLEFFRKIKEGENDKLLSEYKSLCGKVNVEILKIEKYDEPLHKLLVELISGLHITKLVMGITFMKSSSWKSRGGSGLLYVHRHKPDFCELFMICGGKLVFMREENNEGIVEDEQGVMVVKFKEKGSFRGWLGKKLPESGYNDKNLPSSSTSNNDSPDQWENYEQEMESYFHQLESFNSDGDGSEVENDTLWKMPDMPENMSAADKIEALKVKITKAHDMIQLKRKEAQANIERHTKAEWAICLCTRRAEELEAHINEEIAVKADLKKELDTAKEEEDEVSIEVEDKKRKLKSIMELQHELSNKLQLSSLAKSRIEAHLERAVSTRAKMVCEIEELRHQRDVLQRRVDFCTEKDAIGMATRLSDLAFSYREFTAEEIRAATEDFSECLRLKSAGDWTNVYRGRIKQVAVAIKLYISINGLSQEAFQAKVKLLSHIRHPHLLAMFGFCSELKCIVFEYMHNGWLRDALFSLRRGSRSRNLNWHARIRIAAQISSGLGFLHSAMPRPIVHGNLSPSKILLDHNLVAKIHGFRPGWCHNQSDMQADMRAFGNLVLQLLTGRNWAGLVEEAVVMDQTALIHVLDENAGQWPLDLSVELAGIALRCLADTESSMVTVFREIEQVREKADALMACKEFEISSGDGADMENSCHAPGVFLCPIFQDVMKNPHVAADGFSYELEAIEEWLRTGHDTSPMTNLKLKNKYLAPNHTLRSLIHDWHNKRSIPLT